MNWKRVATEYAPLVVALAVCLATWYVYVQAWHVGYRVDALGLLRSHFLKFLLILVAAATVITGLQALAGQENIPRKPGVRLLDLTVVLVSFATCFGCYPLWPVALLILTSILIGIQLFSSKSVLPPAERKLAVLRAVALVLLFTLTWYLGASITLQCMHGIGARIEAEGGSDRLQAWATQIIADHTEREHALPIAGATAVSLVPQSPLYGISALIAARADRNPGLMTPDEIPEWVDRLLGRNQGVRGVTIDAGNEPYVRLFTGGSAYHFQIRVGPPRAGQRRRLAWAGTLDLFEWRPGIYFSTEGK